MKRLYVGYLMDKILDHVYQSHYKVIEQQAELGYK